MVSRATLANFDKGERRTPRPGEARVRRRQGLTEIATVEGDVQDGA